MNLDFNQIQEIIRLVSKHKLSEFILKEGEFKLVVRNQGNGTENQVISPVVLQAPAQPAVMAAPAPAAPAPAAAPKAEAAPAPAPAAENAGYLTIKSPMVGTFYRSSTPDKPPFVKVGDPVSSGQTVCIIEAMKLFNEIESDVKGKIVKVLVEDASPVEYDQPLFLVDPS
ncbi:MAG: acetyl-CoA carboxylase biotin carboxyl carrier protein [Bacteroidota bacterium]|jgi:acetyl-CoA carboxylase biotin carboxyl carrier protein